MRRRRSTLSSSGLLLDTLCNALGSVLFIALLVVLLVKDAPIQIFDVLAPDNEPILAELAKLPTPADLSSQLEQLDGSLAQYRAADIPPTPTQLDINELIAQRAAISLSPHTITPQPTVNVANTGLYKPGIETALGFYLDRTPRLKDMPRDEHMALLKDPKAYQAKVHEEAALQQERARLEQLRLLVVAGKIKPNRVQKTLLYKERARKAELEPTVTLASEVTVRDMLGVICYNNQIYITPQLSVDDLSTQHSYRQKKHLLMEWTTVPLSPSQQMPAIKFIPNRPGLNTSDAIVDLRQRLQRNPKLRIDFAVYGDSVKTFHTLRSGLIDLKDDNHPFSWSGFTPKRPYIITYGRPKSY